MWANESLKRPPSKAKLDSYMINHKINTYYTVSTFSCEWHYNGSHIGPDFLQLLTVWIARVAIRPQGLRQIPEDSLLQHQHGLKLSEWFQILPGGPCQHFNWKKWSPQRNFVSGDVSDFFTGWRLVGVIFFAVAAAVNWLRRAPGPMIPGQQMQCNCLVMTFVRFKNCSQTLCFHDGDDDDDKTFIKYQMNDHARNVHETAALHYSWVASSCFVMRTVAPSSLENTAWWNRSFSKDLPLSRLTLKIPWSPMPRSRPLSLW